MVLPINNLRSFFSFQGLLLFFSLIAAWPCVFYLMGILPDFKINLLVLFVSLVGYCVYLHRIKPLTIQRPILIIILTQVMIWVAYSIFYFDSSYYTRLLSISIATLVMIADSNSNVPKFSKIFVYWVTAQSFLSAVGFLLCILGLIQPVSTFIEMDGREGFNFLLFTTNTYMEIFVRPAGFFDEPGALACWGVYALVLNKLFLKNKYIEYTLLICLTVTLSIAFYIQAILYFFLFYKDNILKLLFIAIVSVFSIGFIVSQDELFYDAIIGRIQYDESQGTISGDNRADLSKNAFKVFAQSPIVGIGAKNLAENYSEINSNFFTYFASDGLVGQIVTWMPFVYAFFVLGKGRREVRYGIIILSVGMLQRPFDFCQLLFPLTLYNMLNTLIVEEQSDDVEYGYDNDCVYEE